MKSNKFFILTLMFITLFLFTLGEAEAVCVTPVDNLNVNESMILCSGTYQLNDSGQVGLFIINSTNIILEANNTYIVGNSSSTSVAIDNQAKSNVTIKNLNIANYSIGIRIGVFGTVENNTIYNNTLANFTIGIRIRANDYNTIDSNRFVNGITSSSSSITIDTATSDYNIIKNNIFNNVGYAMLLQNLRNTKIEYNNISNVTNHAIYLDTNAISNNITNNRIYNVSGSGKIGIELNSLTNYTIINNNFIDKVKLSGIRSVERYTFFNTITNNIIYNSEWNSLDADGFNHTIQNNILINASHTGLDLCGGNTGNLYSGNRTFENNSVENGTLYVCAGYNDLIKGNTINIKYSVDETSTNRASGIDGNLSASYNETFKDNTFYNSNTFCISTSGINNSWINNTIFNCTGGDVVVGNYYNNLSQVSNEVFYNNIFSQGYARYIRTNAGAFNITINETSTNYHTLQCPIGTSTNITFNYNGRKNLNLNNCTLSTYNQVLAYPFNDVYNVSSASILSSNVDNYSITLSSGQQIIIGNYSFITLTLNNYPSGNLLYNRTGVNVTINDPDRIYNRTNIFVYDNLINTIQSYTNTSLNFTTNFSALGGGDYYTRVIVYTNQSTIIDSGLLPFTIDYNYGVSNCTGNQHRIWQILPLIVLAGFLLYLLFSAELGLFGMLGFLVTLVIELNLIANLIRVILTSC